MTATTTPSQVDLRAILDEIFLVLNEKERAVITKRFALDGSTRQTLEAIGQKFNVTRERVRQIEAIALAKLRRTISNTKLKFINEIGKNILAKAGGVKLESDLISEVLNTIHSIAEIDGHIIRLSLAIDSAIAKQDRTSQFRPFWRDAKISFKDITTIADKCISTLTKQKNVTDESNLINLVRAALANSGKSFKSETIASILPIEYRLKKTENGWGLMSWRHINPRSIRDKALIIMKESQKPLHFVEIANAIADYNFDKKVVTVQAVHNELIRDENFVLIGRGLYALKEWGYSDGTVCDVIESLLNKKSPLSKEEIIRGVLKQRQVKKGTISLNLQKTPWFVRVGRAMYKFDPELKKRATTQAEPKRRRRG